MRTFTIISVLIIALAVSANKCTSDKDVIKNKKGVVVDYNNLDGCNYIIELEDGTKLEPMEVVPEFRFEDKQRVKVSYQVLEGVASTCMAGIIVKITEIESLK